MSASMDLTPADAIEAIWDAVQSAANGYHNTQQWGEEGHFAPDVSYWKQIRAAVDLAKSLTPTPSAKGGDTREAVARICCDVFNKAKGEETEADDWLLFTGEADKILSLIHPQPQHPGEAK